MVYQISQGYYIVVLLRILLINKVIFIVLYVDILLASNDLGLLHETKQSISQNFEMKDLGEASYVIGIEIHREQRILNLSQKANIENKEIQTEEFYGFYSTYHYRG
jgi:uncharacterized protein YuzE